MDCGFSGIIYKLFVCFWRKSPQWAMASSFTRFLDHTQRRTSVDRTTLDEWLARRKDLHPHNTQHSQQTNIHAPGGFRTHNLSRRAAADQRLRPRGHWLLFVSGATAPRPSSSFLMFLDHTQRRTTVGRTPLDEWSARRRDLYLTTHNTHNRQISKPPMGFELTISEGGRPQTYALDRSATDCSSGVK